MLSEQEVVALPMRGPILLYEKKDILILMYSQITMDSISGGFICI